MKKIVSISSLFLALPFVAFAQAGTLAPIQSLIVSIGNIISLIIPILIGVAMVAFFWGLILYIKGAGKSASEGKSIMIAGLTALFIMVSVWGIIRFFQSALLGSTSTPQTINAPHFPQN